MSIYIPCLLGACFQEVLHWMGLKQKLQDKVIIAKSADYWIITLVSIAIITLSTPYLVQSFEGAKEWHYLVTAFSFPAIIKKAAKVILGYFSTQEEPEVKGLSKSKFKASSYLKYF